MEPCCPGIQSGAAPGGYSSAPTHLEGLLCSLHALPTTQHSLRPSLPRQGKTPLVMEGWGSHNTANGAPSVADRSVPLSASLSSCKHLEARKEEPGASQYLPFK